MRASAPRCQQTDSQDGKRRGLGRGGDSGRIYQGCIRRISPKTFDLALREKTGAKRAVGRDRSPAEPEICLDRQAVIIKRNAGQLVVDLGPGEAEFAQSATTILRNFVKMPPCKLTVCDPESLRATYRLVRLDTYADVPGKLIIWAYPATGMCIMRSDDGTNVEYNFGPDGLAIVPAGRR